MWEKKTVFNESVVQIYAEIANINSQVGPFSQGVQSQAAF